MSNQQKNIIKFIADVHIGNHRVMGDVSHTATRLYPNVNTRCALALEVLSRVDATALFIAGDLFDTDNPSPQMLGAVGTALGIASTRFGGHREQLVWVTGNHDIRSQRPYDGAQAAYDCLFVDGDVVDAPRVIFAGEPSVEVLCVPYSRQSMTDAIEASLLMLRGDITAGSDRVLCVHAGVMDASTPAYLRGARDAVSVDDLFDMMERADIVAAFTGNWHTPQEWERGGRKIVQCGALVPTGFDNPGPHYGWVHALDTETMSVSSEKISGPRFLTNDLSKLAHTHGGGHNTQLEHKLPSEWECTALFVRELVRPDQVSMPQGAYFVDGKRMEHNVYVERRVVPANEKSMQQLVIQARSIGDLDRRAAVVKYINEMQLPSEVSTEQLAEYVTGLLK